MNKSLFEDFLQRAKITQEQSTFEAREARVITPALPPGAPSYPRKTQYIAINLAREGANLALREKSLDVVESAIRSARPDFDADTKLILSVVELGPPGGPTAGDPIITQRHVAGTLTGASVLGEPPPSSYGAGPTYTAKDFSDSSIRARAPLPNSLTIRQGQSVYVAEIYLKRRDITPLAGVQLPNSLYSVAYF